ncbi:helix-turn-helix domain-containing protein [Mangrovicoccus algicola]|uniref:Uncharacterized protein n=1 Tax=Mangrovicoccus algicola TaxID=2771008 RepID=A0A8J6Z6R2_9RHOB|nr:hypothetical protein [Mangrovicoccus algicola]MBE3637475.1 hypothetical protein [Mangrovicoccus algicola]
MSKVRLLALAGMDARQIGAELGISAPTVRKHYFPKGPVKKAAQQFLVEQRARMMMFLDEAAAEGNVAAQKEMLRLIDALEPGLAGEALPGTASAPREIGKKAARQIAAEAHAAAGGKYAPPAQPKLVVSNRDE